MGLGTVIAVNWEMETSFSASQTFCVMSLVERKQHNIAYYRNDSVHSLFTSERRVRANQISTTRQFENPTYLNIFFVCGFQTCVRSNPNPESSLYRKWMCNPCHYICSIYYQLSRYFFGLCLLLCYSTGEKLCCLSSNSWFCMYVLDCSIESAPN